MARDSRIMPGGAEMTRAGTSFRVWAPHARDVEVVFEDGSRPPLRLTSQPGGYFEGVLPQATAGLLYRYQLDGLHRYPDPYSRFQPQGPHGPSMVVDRSAYEWHDVAWQGVKIERRIIYEIHIGAFTAEGTFDAAARELPALADLGITCLELMPIAEFPGRFNWGYDGVDLFSPYHGYGDYDALKRFVDTAHSLNLAVILDVVYNHLGADGDYLAYYSRNYFTDRYPNEWGDAINFDGPSSSPVRELFIENAAYWIREFHLDGLRLDATQSLYDSSERHVIACIVEKARAAAGSRSIIMIGENEPQRAEMLRQSSQEEGLGLDALWNDDFHHSARVALTGRHDGYFHDYRGRAQEFVSLVKRGFLFQGQRYAWQKKPRGSPTFGCKGASFVCYTQNHDQVANTFYGMRLHQLTSPGRLRAITALLLLGPQTPMLFMGQEFNAPQPFAFFAHHNADLAPKVWEGRKEFMRQFPAYATPEAQARLLDPADPATFEGSRLNHAERAAHRAIWDLHRDLLAIRRDDPVISRQRCDCLDGAVLAERAFLLRWFDDSNGDRLLIINLGDDVDFAPAPEPLLAPPPKAEWKLRWSSNEPRYDGPGVVDPSKTESWRIPAESAFLFVSGEPS